MTTINLPEPSGPVTYHDVKNSYGGRGAYWVGDNEFEEPDVDVQWASQWLADALAARDYQRRDRLGRIAYEAYNGSWLVCDGRDWDEIPEFTKEQWRLTASAVALHVNAKET